MAHTVTTPLSAELYVYSYHQAYGVLNMDPQETTEKVGRFRNAAYCTTPTPGSTGLLAKTVLAQLMTELA